MLRPAAAVRQPDPTTARAPAANMANMLDDIATRFMAFSDALEASFGDISIDFSLPSRTGAPGKPAKPGAAAAAAGDAKALAAAAAERTAAKKRGDEILAQLPPSYFDSSFDALEHELRQLGSDANQADIDTVVDRLTAAMEVVSMQLAKHVLINQGKLIAGITNVTLVEDDLRAAHVICQGTRAQLRMASDEVKRQITIITSTRKKQHCLELFAAASKMKQVQDLAPALRGVHAEADYAEGILLCVDCFKVVEELSQFKVAPALQLAVQRAYYDTMQRMSMALQNVCADFTGEGYSRLLEAYLLQGVPGEALSDKVLSCFRGHLQELCMRLVRSMVLARLAFSEQAEPHAGDTGSPHEQQGGGSSSGSGSYGGVLEECSFAELCRRVAPDMLGPVMAKLLEAVYDLLVSYDSMQAWQEAGLSQHSQAAAAAAAAAAALAVAHSPHASQDGGADGSSAPDVVPSQQQVDHVQAATKHMLTAVHAALASNRASVVEAAAVHLKDLLVGAGGCSGADFPKVVESCLRFAALAEAFAGGPMPMRAAYVHVLGAFIRGSHKSTMQAMKRALGTEAWAVAAPASGSAEAGAATAPGAGATAAAADVGCIARSLAGAASSGHSTAACSEDSLVADFGVWARAGNPFRPKSSRAAGGASLVDAAVGTAVQPAAAPQATASANSSSSSSSSPAGAPVTVSHSCLLVLRWLAGYAGLMAALPAQQQVLWAGMCELFDNYLLACFVLFGGTSLETLVWREGCLPHRLRSALVRITTGANCKYKAEVEELLRTKPAPAAVEEASSSSSSANVFLGGGGGGGGGPSKLDAFTRKFKDTVVELINTDLAQPLHEAPGGAAGGGPTSLTPRQQQQQGPARPQTPQPQSHQGQQQQQQQGQGQGHVSRSATPTGGGAPAPAQQPAASGDAAQNGSTAGQQQGGHAAMLCQRVMAIGSLTTLADALRAAKPGLLARLGASGGGAGDATPAGGPALVREVEAYFARTVDAAADLRDAIYMSGARQLLAVVADPECGLAAQVSACNYALREPATRYQPWVGAVVQQYRGFGDAMATSGLTPELQLKMWEAGVKVGAEALLEGIGRVRRCSQEGRAAMSLDLSAVERGLRALAPAPAMSSLRLVDAYIKAFYIPWEDLGRWAQTHAAEYGRARILVLVEVMADAYGVKRGQKAALMERISLQLAEFAC